MNEEITFKPRSCTHRLQVSDIYIGDKHIGQERILYGKPYILVNGKLQPNPPKYFYCDFRLAEDFPSPTRLSFGEDENGRERFCPAWSSLEDFVKHCRSKKTNKKGLKNEQHDL